MASLALLAFADNCDIATNTRSGQPTFPCSQLLIHPIKPALIPHNRTYHAFFLLQRSSYKILFFKHELFSYLLFHSIANSFDMRFYSSLWLQELKLSQFNQGHPYLSDAGPSTTSAAPALTSGSHHYHIASSVVRFFFSCINAAWVQIKLV